MIELFNTDEWSVRRDLILDDPTLLSHEADIVLEELALHPHLTEHAGQLGRVIVDIRESGVEAALAVVLTIEEYHEWQRSDYDADVFTGVEPQWRAAVTTGRLRTDAPDYHALINGVLTLSARGELELATRILRGEMGRRVEHVLEVAVDAPDADRLDAISVLVYQSSEGGGALEAAALTARAVASVWSAAPERAAGFVAEPTFEDPAHRTIAVAMCERARDTVPARSDGIDGLLVALRRT